MFVVTGVLESMERDDVKSLIERHGGKVTGNISKKTTYLVQGRDSGVSKLEKVSLSCGSGFTDLMRTKETLISGISCSSLTLQFES